MLKSQVEKREAPFKLVDARKCARESLLQTTFIIFVVSRNSKIAVE
jgi:hypothetical protein